ncbi:phage tail assembly chaperone [Vreelandella glaciei]|uniref:phage tail assembly chaperone n=1 Tax=Vreelandella glaciei TaxID=186761 RepID=UPI0030EB2DDD|tara:strand:- start:9680 stop:10108 length:429 start_codon:yes stop_codon:yes gene_type:complete
MAAKKQPTALDPRQALLQPLAGYRHKEMDVPTSNAKVIVREPGGDDWLMWQAQLQEVAGEDVSEENADEVAVRITETNDHTPEATLLVRVLINPETYQRVFEDEDVPTVAANWGPVYGRFLNAAFELAGIGGAKPVEDAKKN